MSEEAIPQTSVVPPATESLPTRPEMEAAEVKGTAPAKLPEHEASVVENAKGVATSESATAPTHAVDINESTATNDEQSTDTTQNKPAISPAVAEMKEDAALQVDRETGEAAAATSGEGAGAQASAGNSKARRKSGGVPEHKGKKLSKKASKAKMTHIDAKPGDYFMVRLKGYPPWPGIICDESMLPASLLKSRPVTAAGPDGTYRADYQDGGSKAKDRTFPVMYLYTNEFGWVPNTDLNDLDFDTVADIPSSVRKDLYAAHQLAAEKHDLDYFKQILKSFMEQRAADLQAKEAAKEAAKAAKKANKTKKQSKAAAQEDGDIEMADAPAEADSEGAEATGDKPKKSKKRKAEEDGLTDSAKKPKTVLKLTNTPKSTSTPKTPKDQSASKSKPKPKKAAAKPKEPEAATPKEPEMTEEEKRVKKEKEILFLRHRLQKGLLLKDQEPKAEEMLSMSEFIAKLEGYADLEVSIIRATKINKVLKAILKLGTIPKEEEFNFKSRSQALLDKWNKLLAVEQDTPPTPATNGVKQDTEATNGVKDRATNENADVDTALGDIKSKEEAPGPEEAPKPPATEPTAVEATD